MRPVVWRRRAEVARRAHNPEVVGSIPTVRNQVATKYAHRQGDVKPLGAVVLHTDFFRLFNYHFSNNQTSNPPDPR